MQTVLLAMRGKSRRLRRLSGQRDQKGQTNQPSSTRVAMKSNRKRFHQKVRIPTTKITIKTMKKRNTKIVLSARQSTKNKNNSAHSKKLTLSYKRKLSARSSRIWRAMLNHLKSPNRPVPLQRLVRTDSATTLTRSTRDRRLC